jgi:ankyrin repeat protein
VFYQLESLRRSVQPDVRGVLEKLPKTLDETFERVLEDITETNRDHARRLFHCLAVAVRPLRVEELAEILSFDFDETQGGIPTFRRLEDQIEAILSACSSLITIVNDGDSRVVQFSHQSVKEFFTSNILASPPGNLSRFHILPTAAHTIFAQVCLGSLLHLEDHLDDESSKSLPLAKYAAQHWVTHAQFEDVASSVEDGMQSLFDPDQPHFSAWVEAYDMDGQSDGKSQSEIPNSLYYAALCGFHDLVKHLATKHPQHVNAIGGFYEFPLVAALCRGNFRVAEVLLAHGGTVDVRGSGGETVLHKIMRLNEETINAMRFLLERGADVNIRLEDLSTPLHLAVVVGESDAAWIPLDHDANDNSQDIEGQVPSNLLSRQDVFPFEDNRSILSTSSLESGANLNAQTKANMTHLASSNQKFEIVRALLDHGANTDAENDKGRTPLQEVLRDGRLSHDGASVARLLLERGAEAYGREKYHVTASDLAFCFAKDNSKLSQVLFARSEELSLDNDRTAFHLWLKGNYHYSKGISSHYSLVFAGMCRRRECPRQVRRSLIALRVISWEI